MENSSKKMKTDVKTYLDEFRFGETKDDRLPLLMQVIIKFNLQGQKFSLNVDSIKKSSIYFLQSITGSSIIPFCVESKSSEVCNAIFYLGKIEEQLNIKVVTLVTDRSPITTKDFEKFKITDGVFMKIINDSVLIYKDPYHLFKSLMKFIISNKTEINVNLLTKYVDDSSILDLKSYENSHK
jgi:hypothetical protein